MDTNDKCKCGKEGCDSVNCQCGTECDCHNEEFNIPSEADELKDIGVAPV